ncbi:hypothetical protein N7513_010076 [Penicillium frequentans]|nr:hypothetical protein N7513_010076 [Penicillium glabrum]
MATGYWEVLNLRAVITILVPSLVLWIGHRTYSHYFNHLPSSSSAPRERLEKLQEEQFKKLQDERLKELQAELDSETITHQDYFAPDHEYWLYYPAKAGLIVTGWPSQGGVYKLDVCSRPELEFLELDLFNDTLRPSTSDPEWQNKENAHCDRMRRLGPTWWESEMAYFYNQLDGLSGYDGTQEKRNNYIRVGWPTGGGVWVWQPKDEAEASEKGGAKLQNANTMDERYELIESLGGTFYADPQSCPYLDLP